MLRGRWQRARHELRVFVRVVALAEDEEVDAAKLGGRAALADRLGLLSAELGGL